jgi:hypothetical protein
MVRFKTRSPMALGAVVALVLIGVLAVFSYRTAARFDTTFKAAGINPQSLAAWHPPAHHS